MKVVELGERERQAGSHDYRLTQLCVYMSEVTVIGREKSIRYNKSVCGRGMGIYGNTRH